MAGLVTAVPQLVWLSEHKPLVFGLASALLTVAGFSLWYGRSLPCPADETAARSCRRLRRLSAALYGLALASFALGTTFAFIVPMVSR